MEETNDEVENENVGDENHDSDGSSSRQDLSSTAKDDNIVHNDHFWPETSNTIDEEADDGIIVEDPILFDAQEHEDEGPPVVALVHGVVAAQNKKKPKFRSRKLTKQK